MELFYERMPGGRFKEMLNTKTFKSLAEHIFKEAVYANGLTYRKKGKRELVELWRVYFEEEDSVILCKKIARQIVHEDDYHYKTVGRKLNKRNLACVRHKVERHCLSALGIKYESTYSQSLEKYQGSIKQTI